MATFSFAPPLRGFAVILLLVRALALAGQGDLTGSADFSGGTGSECGVTMSCASSGASGGSCSDPGTGETQCGASGPASPGNTSGAQLGAGNPINVVSGNKYQRETDLPALPGVLGIEIVRHYNSRFHGLGQIGRGWKLSYETDLHAIGATLQIVTADGQRFVFNRDPRQPGQCVSPNPAHGRLRIVRNAAGREEYRWIWTDGRVLAFDSDGQLESINLPGGQFLTLRHGPRRELLEVADPQGRRLVMRYADPRAPGFHGIVAIDSPVGRFTYRHDDDPKSPGISNLLAVTFPGQAVSRLYHYERERQSGHPDALTGISVQGTGSDGGSQAIRLSTWSYDAQGRAVLSAKGEPRRPAPDGRPAPGTGIEQVELSFVKPSLPGGGIGETVLTNSQGRTTTYRHAQINGESRLLEVRGPGCASCGETDVRYGYGRDGQLAVVTRLDPAGHPLTVTRFTRDTLGRIVEIGRQLYANGRPGAVRRIEWREYLGDTQQPTLIAQPSVVPGRQHRIEVRYDDVGQPLAVTERGFNPSVVAGAEPTPIERTVTYRYARINGRSLLVEIDGPLPNGPKQDPSDSDITRLEWDDRGFALVRWIAPGGHRTALTYDAGTGRIVGIKDAEGLATDLTYHPRGELATIRSAGSGEAMPRVVSFKYDSLGQRTEVGLGEAGESGYRPQVRQSFDAQGRLSWGASALGILQQARYDSESRLIGFGRYGGRLALVRDYDYDEYGRPTRIADGNGAHIAFTYDSQGRLQALTDALNRRQPLHERRLSRGQAGGADGDVPPARQLRDDFGRVVATVSPDAGITSREFDASDRLVASADANGNHASYAYDVQGRIVSQSVFEAGADRPVVTRWRYEGRRLVALDNPAQNERYRYDGRGRLTARVVEIQQADGSVLTSVTRYAYDEDGRLQGVSLPDGSRLVYERNGQGQVVTVRRSRIETPWLRWLLPAQLVAEDLRRDLLGVTGYVAGNGVEARIQRSRAGVLARLSYRSATLPGKSPATARAGGSPEELLGISFAHAADGDASSSSPGSSPLPGALGLPAAPDTLIDHRYLWDAGGNLLLAQDKGWTGAGRASFAYDGRDHLIVAARADAGGQSADRYYYDAGGRRLLAQTGLADQRDTTTNTRRTLYQPQAHRWLGEGRPAAEYDANGQPVRSQDRDYRWDALGRLAEVRQQGRTLAQYAYNHRGERIAKSVEGRTTRYLYGDGRLVAEVDGQGRISRQYLYLADQPLAVIDTPQGVAPDVADRSVWEGILNDLATAAKAWFGDDERIVWLHVDHLGAVEAATDRQGNLVWRANYDPFGGTRIAAAGFNLNLRRPGQYEDGETGLYYNGRRYYDPQRGEYLTPDPLGTPDGPNPYAYVRGNPLRYVDPQGLVLFAFDGTNNTNDENWLRRNGSSLSNVWRFWELYEDGNRRYVSGVGTLHRDQEYGDIVPPVLDSGFNFTGVARIDRMIQYFNAEADLATDDSAAMDVDIVAFSRGAAEARDFANQIVAHTSNGWYRYTDAQGRDQCQKVNFRFMGLFDTVLSWNAGRAYHLTIPDAFAYVAQAVALNEYRGDILHPYGTLGDFPLESILPGMASAPPVPGETRIERGFIGAHADIGGGFGENDSQLAQVALAWMVEQAKSAGINMLPAPSTIIANPVIHDKSDSVRIGAPAPRAEDREVRYGNGATTRQRDMVLPASMSWVDTQQFIRYLPQDDPRRHEFFTGTVDMASYLDWLDRNDYSIHMTVQ